MKSFKRFGALFVFSFVVRFDTDGSASLANTSNLSDTQAAIGEYAAGSHL